MTDVVRMGHVSVHQRKAHYIRLAFGLISIATVFIALWWPTENALFSLTLGLTWSFSIFIGNRIPALRKRTMRKLGPSWKSAFWTAFIFVSALSLIFSSEPLATNFYTVWDAIALGCAIAYTGGKLGCVVLGCCPQIRPSIVRGTWRCSLNGAEVVVSTGLFACSMVTFLICPPGTTALFFFIGHGVLRSISLIYRMPSDKPLSNHILSEVAILGLALLIFGIPRFV